jgi:hypothetical protein
VRIACVAPPVLLCLLIGGVLASAQDAQPARQTKPTGATSKPSSQPASRPAAKNLLTNGDFETPDDSGKLPAHWTTKHSDNVQLVDLGGSHGRVIEMTGGKKLMASYGVDLTSEKIPVEANTRYRCAGFTKSDGPNMKVFVKGYATVTRKVEGQLETFDDIVYQMRKDIEPSEDWQPFNLEFEITPAEVFSDFQHQVKYVRIRLWAFWPAGKCWFDDICFEEVEPVPENVQRHADAVTHVGLPPRLGAAATRPAPNTATAGGFDEGQTWRDAVNAFRADDHERAIRLAEQLLTHAPRKGAYHLLAARTLAKLKRWDEAEQHARWLLEAEDQTSDVKTAVREIEGWQRDWAHVVLAKVCRHTGRVEQARATLRQLLQATPSPHARAAAERLLAEIDQTDEGNERKP